MGLLRSIAESVATGNFTLAGEGYDKIVMVLARSIAGEGDWSDLPLSNQYFHGPVDIVYQDVSGEVLKDSGYLESQGVRISRKNLNTLIPYLRVILWKFAEEDE